MNPEKNSDAKKGKDDGQIGQAGTNEGKTASGGVLGGQHTLDHVLIGSVGGHGDKGRGKEGGPDGIFTFQNTLQGGAQIALHDGAKTPKGEVAGLVEFSGDGGQATGDGVK